jgi:hypothetical protein
MNNNMCLAFLCMAQCILVFFTNQVNPERNKEDSKKEKIQKGKLIITKKKTEKNKTKRIKKEEKPQEIAA